MPLSDRVPRMKMLPWLEMQIDSKKIDGLTWIDREKKIFRVPWKHASRQGWKVLDATIFKAWAVYTDRFKEDTEIKDQKRARALAKTWKANFRCALNAQNDRIRNLSGEGTKKGNDAFKVYQIVSKGSCNERKDNINYGVTYGKQSHPHRPVCNKRIAKPKVANSTLKSKSKPLSHPKIPYDHNDHPYSSSYNSNLSLWTDRIHPDSPTAWNGGYYSGFPDIVSEQLLSKFDIWNTQVPAGSHLERYSQSHMDPNYISQLAADVFTTVAMYGSEFYNGNDSYASSSSPHSSISDGGFEQPPGYFDHTIHGMKQETISPINSPPVSPNTDIFKPHAKDPNMGELIGNVLNFDTSYGVYQFPV